MVLGPQALWICEASGFGLGFERMILFTTGLDNTETSSRSQETLVGLIFEGSTIAASTIEVNPAPLPFQGHPFLP